MLTSICVDKFWTLFYILLSFILILTVTEPEVNDKSDSDSENDQETFEPDIKNWSLSGQEDDVERVAQGENKRCAKGEVKLERMERKLCFLQPSQRSRKRNAERGCCIGNISWNM